MIKGLKKVLPFFLIANTINLSACNNINNLPTRVNNIAIEQNANKNLLVRFNPEVTQNQIKAFKANIDVSSFEIISDSLNMVEMKVNNEAGFEKLKKACQNSNLIKYAEEDGKLTLFPYQAFPVNSGFSVKSGGAIPNDQFYGFQWNATSIDADKVWSITTGTPGITVAVIDSGVDPDHPDLKDNLLPLIDILNEDGEDDLYRTGGTEINYGGRDGNGHGTHVTGVVGAMINNAKGVAGIAGNVKILPIKAANHEGSTSASIITKSILKAIEKGVKVINLSIGGPKSEGTQALKDTVELAINKGIVFISATGNESNRFTNFVEEVTVPAAYPGVIAVAAFTKFNKVANYSNGGPEVEIAAPGGAGRSGEGEKIYSTWPTYKTYEGYRAGIIGPYAYLSGTSMACPHVSAAAALLLSKEPKLTAQQVRVRLLSTAIDIDAKGFDTSTGYGKLNIYKAMMANTHDKK